MRKSRLDHILVGKGLAQNRSQAQKMIMAGLVSVNGDLVTKPSSLYDEGALVKIINSRPYVSRGGEKLEAALRAFGLLDLEGMVCVDIGASTGGFTDCLLKHGARRVYAVDVGYGQLHWDLRNDPRVVVMERTNARNLTGFPEAIQLVTVDASFISLTTLLCNVRDWFGLSGGQVVGLIKPQFEAGRREAAKGRGVIRDPLIHRRVLKVVLESAAGMGYGIYGLTLSPLLGPKGNVEYFVHLCFPVDLQTEITEMINAVLPVSDTGTTIS